MDTPFILHLETATTVCSVALSKGDTILSFRETHEERSHGATLTLFMDEVLKESGINPAAINAIAVSKGPGSYTGLRIGVSVTKGFAYAQNIPVIGICTLRLMASAAMQNEAVRELQKQFPHLLLCPMIDAKRMEVYSAVYDFEGAEVEPVSAKIIDQNSFENYLDSGPVAFFGNGSDKIKETITHKNGHFIPGITPSSRFMVPLAVKNYQAGIFEDTAYFEPFYLKDFIATIPKKKVF